MRAHFYGRRNYRDDVTAGGCRGSRVRSWYESVATLWPLRRTLRDIRGHESPKRRRVLSDGKLRRVASRQQFVFPSRAGSSPVSRSRYLGPKRQV